MKTIRVVPIAILSAAVLAACNGEVKQQLATVQHVDSLRVDSLANIRKDLLEEVMTSTQFVNQINTELAKARRCRATTPAQLETNAEVAQVNEERKRVVAEDHAPRRPPRLGPGSCRQPAHARLAALAEGFGARRAGRRLREDDLRPAGVG